MRRTLFILLLASRSVAVPALTDPAEAEPQDAPLWIYPVGDRLAGPPAAASRWIAAATTSGRLFALESGRPLPVWESNLGAPIVAGPLLQDFRLIVATRTGNVEARDLRTGELLWARRLPGSIAVSPGFDGVDRLWVPVDSGELIAVATDSGEPVEVKRLTGLPATAPIRCGDRIIVGTSDGRVLGFSGKSEQPVWDRRCGKAAPGPPTCDRDAVLVGCDRSLFRFGLKKGKVRWRYGTGARVTARPLVHDRNIYIASYDNHLYVLKRKNGHPVRTIAASHRVHLDPIRSGNLLFLLPETASEIAVHRLPAAEPIGRIPIPDAEEAACTEPVVVGRGILVIGCGGDSASLFLLRAPESSLDFARPFVSTR
jgi:outer membrane protein assembly factor BamB